MLTSKLENTVLEKRKIKNSWILCSTKIADKIEVNGNKPPADTCVVSTFDLVRRGTENSKIPSRTQWKAESTNWRPTAKNKSFDFQIGELRVCSKDWKGIVMRQSHKF